jgi:peptide/nickel transport system substrate-binding protein
MGRIFFLVILVIAMNSCRSPELKDDAGSVFRYNEYSNITSLDPAFAKDQPNIWACNQLYNGLLQMDDSLRVRPCIAKEWHVDSSGRHYTFLLRNDVYFHDHRLFPGGTGRKVIAEDFVYSFSRILDTSLISPGLWVFGKLAFENNSPAIKALNDSTLQISLKDPFPPFAGILTMIYCSVVPHEIVEHYGKEFRRNPVGTGPFFLKTWKENVKLVMLKNTNYFERYRGEKLPFLDAVSVTFIKDKQAAFLEFVKGKLDFISGLDPSYKDELLTKDGQLRSKYRNRFRMMTQPYLNTEYVGILVDTTLDIVKNSPLKSQNVRRAINYGFDREKMIRYLRNNIGYPGRYGIIPPGLPAFDSTQAAYDYNPQKARQLLRDAGFTENEPIEGITLHTTAEYLDIFKYLQSQLEEIGMKIDIEVNPAATLMQMKAHSKVGFFRASWIADYPDEENYLALFASQNLAPSGPNYSQFKNRDYDSLYLCSQLETDPAKRVDLYKKMNRIIIDQSPVVILYYDQVVRFTHLYVHDLGTNPMNLLSLKKVNKEDR